MSFFGAGRPTLSSGIAIPETDLAGQPTVYFTPVQGAEFAIWDGSAFALYPFSEIGLPLSTTYHVSGFNYDLFVIWNGSALTYGTGPAWTSNTARNEEIGWFGGIWANQTSLAIRWGTGAGDVTTVAANQARYVGSFRATANGQATDSRLKRLLFSAECQASRRLYVDEAANYWAYSTMTFRQVNANASNKVEILNGLGGSLTRLRALGLVNNSTSTPQASMVGIGIDSATVDSSSLCVPAYCTNTIYANPVAEYADNVGLGYHTLNWLERGGGADTQTWRGTNTGAAVWRTGLTGEFIG